MKETSITRERARAILALIGHPDEYDPQGDYFVATSVAGEEFLTVAGDDRPFAQNQSSQSWLGSGMPH